MSGTPSLFPTAALARAFLLLHATAFCTVLCGTIQAQEAAVSAGAAVAPASIEASPSPGRLCRIPIFLEVSDNLLDTIPIPSPQTRWSLPEEQAPAASMIFLKAGLAPNLVEALTSPSAILRADGWVHFFPSNQIVEGMSRETRAALYSVLSLYEINEFQESPVLILTNTVEEWYRHSRLTPETVSDISRLAYRRGDVWAFSDVALLVSKAQNEDALKEFFKNLTRTRTYLVRMAIGPDTDASAVKSYWRPAGIGFRRKDIEPIIESLKETGSEVQLDLVHIMPPLARKLLYTYPGPENASQGILPDCHWTSLNYFNYEPHGYLLDSGLATSKVLEDYEEVSTPYRYGDILFFIDTVTGDAFHSCIYLAEVLVFTKNGRNQMAPWIISTQEDTARIYLSARSGRIQAYRRRESRGL